MGDIPIIPGYTIKKLLGRGGMGSVYLGVKENRSQLVAIKVLFHDRFNTPQLLKRFLKEAQIASRLIHPNIVTVFEVGRTKSCHYMVMEYLPESLRERLRRNQRIRTSEALFIVRQVAAALFYAHRKGFIHRDIKPSNIMFQSDGTPVVLDFGIARAIESTSRLTRTGISLGTPQYMSPEQCASQKLDGRSDIYSLGVVLFEMLSGEVPYKAKSLALAALRHIYYPVPDLPSALSRLQPLIDRMMAKDKNRRVRSEAELNALLKDHLRAVAPAAKFRDRPGRGKSKSRVMVDDQTRLPGGKRRPAPPTQQRSFRQWQKRRVKSKFYFLIVLTVILVLLIYLVIKKFLALDLIGDFLP